MNIKWKVGRDVPFTEVDLGGLFVRDDELWCKFSDEASQANSRSANKGYLKTLYSNTLVTPVYVQEATVVPKT